VNYNRNLHILMVQILLSFGEILIFKKLLIYPTGQQIPNRGLINFNPVANFSRGEQGNGSKTMPLISVVLLGMAKVSVV
jgi:hypothetical protein